MKTLNDEDFIKNHFKGKVFWPTPDEIIDITNVLNKYLEPTEYHESKE